MAGYGKDTQDSHEQRVAFIYKLIINGIRTNYEIYEYIQEVRKKPLKRRTELGWPKENAIKALSQIENLTREARSRLVTNSIKDTTEMTEELIAQHYEILKKAVKAKKYGVARGCLKEIAYLKGLGNFTLNGKIEHEVTGETKREKLELIEEALKIRKEQNGNITGPQNKDPKKLIRPKGQHITEGQDPQDM